MFEKFYVDEHPEKFANFDIDFGADKPLDRWDTYLEDRFENWDLLHAEKNEEKFANLDPDFGIDTPLDGWDTSLEDWGHTMGNTWGPLLKETIGNMFERRPKIFTWTATGSFSFARSLGKSLLDFFR